MKKTLFVLFLASGVLFGGFLAFSKPKPSVQKALTLLQEESYSEAEGALKLAAKGQKIPISLYQSYLAQTRGRFEESDFFLQMALKEPDPSGDLLLQVCLSQASNAYFSGRDGEIDTLVQRAKRTAPHEGLVVFYEGLAHYIQDKYGEALKYWTTFTEPQEESTTWLASVSEKLFPLTWRQLHVAHCLTEEGDFLTGREILERESHQLSATEKQLHNLATLFLGLTYLKECSSIPLDQRGSYYKLAHFYFERAGVQTQFARERGRMTRHIQDEIGELLSSDPLDATTAKWAFSFVHTLQDWKAEKALFAIVGPLADRISSGRTLEMCDLCKTLREEFEGGLFYSMMKQQMVAKMSDCLKTGTCADLVSMWKVVQTLCPRSQREITEIAFLTKEQLFQTINRDKSDLTKTRMYIDFWKSLGQGRKECVKMAHDLIAHAELFWKKGGQEKKGLRLMKLALELSGNAPSAERKIETLLTDLYRQADQSNMIQRLTIVYDALDYFGLGTKELVSRAKLANHLADAQYLFDSRNYSSSKTHASWVLKIEPYNQDALRLAGLSAFNLGEYDKALSTLAKVSDLDEYSSKALMLSQVFATSQQEKHLCQTDYIETFEDED